MAQGASLASAPGRYAALLEITQLIASHRTLEELTHDLAPLLRPLIRFQYLALVLHDEEQKVMRLHTLEGQMPRDVQMGMAFPMEDSPSAWVLQNQQPFIVEDVEKDAQFSRQSKLLQSHGVRSLCAVPLSTPRRRLGAINLGSREPGAYGPEEIAFAQLVGRQVAVAVENALNYQKAQELQEQVTRERDRLKLLLDVNNAVVSQLSLAELFRAIPASVRMAMQCDAACLSLPDDSGKALRIHGLDFPDGRGYLQEEGVLPIEGSSPGAAFREGKPVIFGAPPDALHRDATRINAREGFHSGCFVPLVRGEHKLGVLHLLDRRPAAFSNADAEFLGQVGNQVAIALENALRYREIHEATSRLAEERSYLQSEIRTEYGFEKILGESPGLRQALVQAETVAPTGSTVLILGETGTGKELIARAIHQLSARREQIFAKLNCAAIPSGLLESELFGHEKGAFTGAIAQKLGRFELAHQGTLFLDEVGDIPLELQPKLLRVLQEQEFERLGGTRSIHVDVRLIAATNRDLGKMVEEREFRADLFYRLNVFPIRIPPLRQRKQDIPILVRHFTDKYAKTLNRKITEIPDEVMEALMRYEWPGNIRELQNFIERAVILSSGPALAPQLAELRPPAAPPAVPANASPPGEIVGGRIVRKSGAATLEEAEREHILSTLRECDWTLSGTEGAAARLGIPRTTLIYKMRRLRIARRPT
jgi:formate hydrogenlyase transcriptional activator